MLHKAELRNFLSPVQRLEPATAGATGKWKCSTGLVPADSRRWSPGTPPSLPHKTSSQHQDPVSTTKHRVLISPRSAFVLLAPDLQKEGKRWSSLSCVPGISEQLASLKSLLQHKFLKIPLTCIFPDAPCTWDALFAASLTPNTGI